MSHATAVPDPSERLGLSSLVPLGALFLLVLGARWPALAPQGFPGDPAFLVFVVGLAALGSLHRPFGGATLSFGTMALPWAIERLGVMPAATAAALAFFVSEILLRLVRVRHEELLERRGLLRLIDGAAEVALATLGAGFVWHSLSASGEARGVGLLVTAALGVGALHAGLALGVAWSTLRLRRVRRRGLVRALLVPLGLDALGWTAGAVVLAAAQSGGVLLGGAVLILLAAWSLESFRNARRTDTTLKRAIELEKVSRAGERVSQVAQEEGSLAAGIFEECRKLVPFHWIELALNESGAPGAETRAWSIGPDGLLREGRATPERFPPPLSGVHRRSRWELLAYALATKGRALGLLRLWCDPRTLDRFQLPLLETLLPQLAASVERAQLDRQARLDPLTGLPVRRVLDARLVETYQRCLEIGSSMAVALLDLDHFKKINDTYGHAAGDQALIAVARLLASRDDSRTLAGRWGGEEFLVLLPGLDGSGALRTAERLRAAVAGLAVEVDGHALTLTASIGIAAFPELYVERPEDLVTMADVGLYEAKRRGRDRCLLNLGLGRFRTPGGEVLVDPAGASAPEPPRLFV
jgi:diguanylate cyclase (GGDEF)-like protein